MQPIPFGIQIMVILNWTAYHSIFGRSKRFTECAIPVQKPTRISLTEFTHHTHPTQIARVAHQRGRYTCSEISRKRQIRLNSAPHFTRGGPVVDVVKVCCHRIVQTSKPLSPRRPPRSVHSQSCINRPTIRAQSTITFILSIQSCALSNQPYPGRWSEYEGNYRPNASYCELEILYLRYYHPQRALPNLCSYLHLN